MNCFKLSDRVDKFMPTFSARSPSHRRLAGPAAVGVEQAAISILARGASRHALSSADKQALRRRLQRARKAAGQTAGFCLSLVDDAEIHALNNAFAGEDHATDVLAFPQQSIGGIQAVASLGDIVISVPTAQRQAAALLRTLQEEILHLAVHGFCHLLGYDHATPEEEREMFAYEALLREQAISRKPVKFCPGLKTPR